MKVDEISRENIVGTWKLEFSSKFFFTPVCGRQQIGGRIFWSTSIHGLYNSFKFEVHSRFDTVFALLLEIAFLQIRELSEVTEIFAKNQNAKWDKISNGKHNMQ